MIHSVHPQEKVSRVEPWALAMGTPSGREIWDYFLPPVWGNTWSGVGSKLLTRPQVYSYKNSDISKILHYQWSATRHLTNEHETSAYYHTWFQDPTRYRIRIHCLPVIPGMTRYDLIIKVHSNISLSLTFLLLTSSSLTTFPIEILQHHVDPAIESPVR